MTSLPHAMQRDGWDGDIIFELPGDEHRNGQDYAALRDDLATHGLRLEQVASFSQQDVIREAIDIPFRVLRDVSEEGYRETIALLVAYLLGRLRRPRSPGAPRRTATIYGPRLDVLATVELDEPQDPGAAT